jgi:predicted metal-dependent HD superfamily phosphohydrolase
MSLETRFTSELYELLADEAADMDYAFDVRPIRSLLETSLRLYQYPTRTYHNLTHVLDCLRHVTPNVSPSGEKHANMRWAILFHDVVYVPGSGDNEAQSADFAAEAMESVHLSLERIEQVRKLIMATTHRTRGETEEERTIQDIDLAGLSYPLWHFNENSLNVRKEFGDVPEDAFNAGRLVWIKSMLDRDSIYYTEAFKQHETDARFNLVRERDALEFVVPIPA